MENQEWRIKAKKNKELINKNLTYFTFKTPSTNAHIVQQQCKRNTKLEFW